MITYTQCEQWDLLDNLKQLKTEFALPDGVIYLDGNSLGARPKAALTRAQDVIQQEWGQDLINSWNKADWWGLSTRLGDKLAPLVGAGSGEIIISDSTTMNLFKVLAAAVKVQTQQAPERKVILAERDAFPTDIYIIEGFIGLVNQGYQIVLIDDAADLPNHLNENVVAVVLSHVNYRSGYFYDMQATNDLVHDHGALMIWDLCHSIGAVTIDLKGTHADFAIGCTYKYLNGGPGSPAMAWVNPKYLGQYSQPLSGWWGHAQPFAMAPSYQPSQGIRQYLCGTQSIISMSLIECGLDIFLKTDMQSIRKKSLQLTDLMIALVEQECAGFGLKCITPTQHHHRGSHVSFEHEQGYAIVQALIARGVIGDYREPHVIRFGITPLYLSFIDIWDAVQHLKAVMHNREWASESYQVRGTVT